MTTTTTPAIDQERLDAILGQFVGDLGAALSAPLIVHRRPARALQGDGRRRARDARASSPRAPDAASATCASGSPARRRAATSTYDPRPRRLPRCTPEQALAFARRRQPGLHPRRLPARCAAIVKDEPHIAAALPHRRGHRLARARPRPLRRHRALLPPRLRRATSSPSGSRRSTASRTSCTRARASPTSAAATAPRRSSWRRRSRPRASSASTTTRPRSRRARRARRAGRRRRPRALRGRDAPRTFPASRLRPRRASSTRCTTWATRSAPRATCAGARARRHAG